MKRSRISWGRDMMDDGGIARGANPVARGAHTIARGADPIARGANPIARGAHTIARDAIEHNATEPIGC